MKKKLFVIFIGIVLLASSLALTSCNNDAGSGDYLVYYTNAPADVQGTSAADDIIYLISHIAGSDEMTPEERTGVLLTRMFDTDPDRSQAYSAKPDWVVIKSFEVENSILTFDFEESYRNLSNVQEILLRAALVLTMIQQPEVSQVVFTVEGEPLTDSRGIAIGAMSAGNFVNILLTEEGMLKQETDLTIFFTDETGTKLIPAKYHFTINNSNTSMEEYILQQIKEGPAIESTYRTMAPDVEILSVITSDSTCYVNFGSNFLEQEQPASDEILIYSIVNSLCSLTYVKNVQFLVDGSPDVILHAVVDLSKPFSRNRELEQ